MLHLIFHTPIAPAILERMTQGDDVLFLNDAVFSLLIGGKLANLLSAKSVSVRFYTLKEDIDIRGITSIQLAPGLKVIDYAEFVRLTTENSLIQSWH